MSLRDRLIEAAAQRLRLSGRWTDNYRPATLGMAAVIVDAMLAVLADNADEWIDEEWDMQVASWSGATRSDVRRVTHRYVVDRLLTVLEAPGDS